MYEKVKNSSSERVNSLFNFARRLIDGENGNLLIEEYRQFIDTVNARETMQVLDNLLVYGYSVEKVKKNTGKIINVFHISLSSDNWEKPGEGHFLHYLMLENREAEKILKGIRNVTKALFRGKNQDETNLFRQLHQLIRNLKDYELHYIKKENILFPYIEKTFPQYRCLKLMWSFHDDFRTSLKKLDFLLNKNEPEKQLLNLELGKLFFVALPIIFREEHIVFPTAFRSIPEKHWAEMLEQSMETGWAYGVKPELTLKSNTIPETFSKMLDLDTGFLNQEQLTILLNSLPVDITFIDENDEVRYFSGAKHRIFPRTRSIIGRKVQNCHPPESVHIVNEIVDAFRNGKRDHADFWIQMNARFIYIRYFAMRNEKGEYRGTIEVSQDVSEIRSLKGEQRLLNWT
jgi:hypothetical protein